MQIDSEVRVVATKTALYGVALMLFGVGLSNQLQVDSAASSLSQGIKEAEQILPMIPSIVGALLSFWGAIRLSVAIEPPPLAAMGVVLEIGANAFPFVAARLSPGMKDYQWVLPSLMPLFILRIAGLMFFSTGVLRWLLSVGNKT
jgi:hypothetical protein